MSIQPAPSRLIPIQYSGYAACSQCGETFYQGTGSETVCRLCRVEQSHRSYQGQRREWNQEHRAAPKPPERMERACEECKTVFMPKRLD